VCSVSKKISGDVKIPQEASRDDEDEFEKFLDESRRALPTKSEDIPVLAI